MLSDSSVTFSWTHQEEDVIYQIIRTTGRVILWRNRRNMKMIRNIQVSLAEYDPPEERRGS